MWKSVLLLGRDNPIQGESNFSQISCYDMMTSSETIAQNLFQYPIRRLILRSRKY